MPFAQLQQQLLPRLVINACQRLQRQILRRFKPRFRHLRPPHNIRIRCQALHHLARQGRRSKPGMMHTHAGRPLQAKPVQIISQLFIVALPGPAQNQIRQNRRCAVAIHRIRRRPRRHQQRHRRRLHPRHLLRQQSQTVIEGVLKISLRQLKTPGLVQT